MDSARTEAHLRDLEAPALAKQNVFFWHTHIVEANVHMTPGRMVFTKDLHTLKYFDTFSICWH